MSLRDCLFLVADKNMEGMLRGFFDREQFHLALKCRPFTFHPQHDLVVAHGQNDSGLFTRANELLQPFAATHRHAVVIVDAQWDGAPPADEIRVRLATHLAAAGWQEDAGCAVVIDPELENWFWQESPHVCRALGEADTPFAEVRRRLTEKGFWPEFQPKPMFHRGRPPILYRLQLGCGSPD